ncbi:SusD/RagB family nutrient-binding outer membrane lipoprotein [Aquimarina sp. U1-2]|uniref:SusD/RagB family nutrient-binding outer membrane lipoprotein n=1 Tax=Aquimarina sp. U1-2 TaxID=2823141 RepID=UPI001AECB34F|nr:SusD/RagB family nutrient-binding outer membrane lipoprotein [Aquimarina sp. U1-2]MBP2833004.1 SusD/RagB family nutrient-binding outer membrane lipoprotein [Aquimarina sp. U1-2]
MKLTTRNILVTIFGMSFLFSCTDDFDALNQDPNGVTDTQSAGDFIDIGGPFDPIFQNIYRYDPAWHTQLQHNLNADTFSGYMAPPLPFVKGVNTTNYGFVDFWDQWAWDVPYSARGVMVNVEVIQNLAKEKELPIFSALALILKVEAMHRVTDVYGPIIYSNYGLDGTVDFVAFDAQEKVYRQFFQELDEAVAILSQIDENNGQFKAFDLVYDGNIPSWIMFANTLRLRLAIRISKVDPTQAKIEGEKALSNPGGLITSNDKNFIIKGGQTHPLSIFNSSWNDVRMNASMESILVGYEDPRGTKMFQESEVVEGTLKGLRGGMPLLDKYNGDDSQQKSDYVAFSKLGNTYDLSENPTTDIQLLVAAETHFLKAEAALRGWTGAGDARTNYERGITTSFSQYEASGRVDYISNSTNTPLDYIDPLTPSNNIEALSDVTIAWNEADDNEKKLEKIITQKWIAMFPDGQEAWSEFRRTGYPKIFPVVVNNSGGTVDTEIQVRRLAFPASERSTNPQGVEDAKSLLKGPDNAGTRLWWDVPGGNF